MNTNGFSFNLTKFSLPLTMLITGMMPIMQGCEPEEVAIGAAAGAIGYVIGREHRYRHYRHRRYYYYNNEATFASTNAMAPMINYGAVMNDLQSQPLDYMVSRGSWSEAYHTDRTGTDYMMDAVDSARFGDIRAMEEFGLDHNNLQRMAQGRLPDNHAISAVAVNLNQDNQVTKGWMYQVMAFNYQIRQIECRKNPQPEWVRRLDPAVCVGVR